jgi:outer membrane protein assembly factor BamE (lipoprotein component of BamABCDE complex)
MKNLKHIVLVVALILVAGCATTFRPWMLSEIEEGMTRGQVVKILGEPDRVEARDGSEFLYYSYSEDYSPPLSEDSGQAYDANRELRKQQLKRNLREYKYSVKLVDGKVQTYTEIQE